MKYLLVRLWAPVSAPMREGQKGRSITRTRFGQLMLLGRQDGTPVCTTCVLLNDMVVKCLIPPLKVGGEIPDL